MIILVPIILAMTVCAAIMKLTEKAILFSKIAFSLFLALVVNSQSPIIENGGLVSYLAWAGIFIAAGLLLCLLPRINYAFLFFCNSFLSWIIAEMTLMTVCGIFFDGYEQTILTEVIIKVICTVISAIALIQQIGKTAGIKTIKIKFLVVVERTIASVIYAVALFLLICVSVNALWEFSLLINAIIFVTLFILAFIADIYMFQQMRNYANSWRVFSRGRRSGMNLGELFDDSSLDDGLYEYDDMMIDKKREEAYEREREDDYYYREHVYRYDYPNEYD